MVEEFAGLQAELTGKIIKVFYAVANELGYGYFESVYKKAMVLALRETGLKVREEVALPVLFHGKNVGTFVADVIVDDRVILELNAADAISQAAVTQLTHSLRSCSIEVGLVLVFGLKAQYKRDLFTNDRKAPGQSCP